MTSENDETETKTCKDCGHDRKLREFKITRSGGRANTCTPCASAKRRKTMGLAVVEREEKVEEAKATASAVPCTHKTVCGDEDVARELPRFFDYHERSPKGAQWQVCVWCGLAKQVQLWQVDERSARGRTILQVEPGGNKPAWLNGLAKLEPMPGDTIEGTNPLVGAGLAASAAVQAGGEALGKMGSPLQLPGGRGANAPASFGDPGPYMAYDKPVEPLMIFGDNRVEEPAEDEAEAPAELSVLDYAAAKAPLGLIEGDPGLNGNAPGDPLLEEEMASLDRQRAELRSLQMVKAELEERLAAITPAVQLLELRVENAQLKQMNRYLMAQLEEAREKEGVA